MLLFSTDNGNLAIDSAHVEGVLSAGHIYFLPGVAFPVRGIITHRTELLPVIDIKGLMWDEPSSPPHTVVVVRVKERGFALCLDEISPVLVDKAECTIKPLEHSHICAQLEHRGSTFMVLDPEGLYKRLVDSFR